MTIAFNSNDYEKKIVGELLIVTDSKEKYNNFLEGAKSYNYNCIFVSKVDDVSDKLRMENIVAIIIDIEFLPKMKNNEIKRIKEQRKSYIPVVFVSNEDNFALRLGAVRAGGDLFIAKPIDIGLMDALFSGAILNEEENCLKVVIIDDDRNMAENAVFILEHFNIDTLVITDPLTTFNKLSDFEPDLILLDMYMPGCSGYEMAKLIRQQSSYSSVPIVFLSVESDREKQITARKVGGDDYLIKPYKAKDLLDSVINRCRRYRMVKCLMQRDGLTGAYLYTKVKSQIQALLDAAERYDYPCSCVLIDLDDFKEINDMYGHLAGDNVLRTFSELVKHRLRTSDIFVRYGGEEFAIFFPHTEIKQALEVVNYFREEFANQVYKTDNNKEYGVTFSAGLTLYQKGQSQADIIKVADELLYKAKKSGKNQILSYDNK